MKKTFLYRDLPVAYTDAGQGIPVVLLHGFAETGAVWQEQVAFLQQHCRVIVPEIPDPVWKEQSQPTDLGMLVLPLYEMPSALPPLPATDPFQTAVEIAGSMDEMAGVVAALIRETGAGPAIVLGHSMGGYVALALAAHYPELLKGLGLIHSSAFADTEEKKETRRKGIAFIRKQGIEAFFKTAVPGLFSEQSKKAIPERLQESIEMAAGYHPEILVAGYEGMMARPDRTDILRNSRWPVLFLIGAADKAAPAADGIKQVHLPAVSYFHLLEKVGHMGMWEATKQVNHSILNFIQDCV